jgi:hypothetical protein
MNLEGWARQHVKLVGTALLALLFAGCTDIVTSRYQTLAEARADELFGRGWLPDVLPPSAVDIVTVNNLDINTSHGEFAFAPAEAPQLFRRLKPGAPTRIPDHAASDVRDAQRRKDVSVGWLHQNDTTWVFMCRAAKGRCEHLMWLERPVVLPATDQALH